MRNTARSPLPGVGWLLALVAVTVGSMTTCGCAASVSSTYIETPEYRFLFQGFQTIQFLEAGYAVRADHLLLSVVEGRILLDGIDHGSVRKGDRILLARWGRSRLAVNGERRDPAR